MKAIVFDDFGAADGIAFLCRLDPSALCQPVAEATPGRSHGLAFRPRQDAGVARDLSGRGDQAEPGGDAADLTIRAFGAVVTDELIAEGVRFPLNVVEALDHDLEKSTAGIAIVVRGRALQMTGEGVGGFERVKILEQPEPGTSIRRDVDDAHLLAGSGTMAAPVLRELVGKADFATRQEEDTPAGGRSGFASSAGSGFAGAVRQHVGDRPRLTPIHLSHFIQAQQSVAMKRGERLFSARCETPPQTTVSPG